jgi:hypothetical protein
VTVNEELVRRALAGIEANPQFWDQRRWFLVSDDGRVRKFCFVGWAHLLAHGVDPAGVEPPERCSQHSEVSARRVLGLSGEQYFAIFGFVSVYEPGRRVWFAPWRRGPVLKRPPTFAELCEKIRRETGVRYVPGRYVPGAVSDAAG